MVSQKMTGIELIRQREEEALRRMIEEEEQDEMEERIRFRKELKRVAPGCDLSVFDAWCDCTDSEDRKKQMQEKMDGIDRKKGFMLIDFRGEIVRQFDNLAQACVAIGKQSDELLKRIILRKPYYDLMLIVESEYRDAWMEGRRITFNPGPEKEDIRSALYAKEKSIRKEKKINQSVNRERGSYIQPIQCVETGERFNSINEASICTGIYIYGIRKSIDLGVDISGYHFVAINADEGYVPQPIGRLASHKEMRENGRVIRDRGEKWINRMEHVQPVIVEETGNIYYSKSYAARLLGVDVNTIYRHIDRKGSAINGFHIRSLTKEEMTRIVFRLSKVEFVPKKRGNNFKKFSIRVVRLDTGEEFESMTAFARKLGISQTSVTYAAERKIFKVKGIPFKIIK